jgi:guanylate kinase
VERDPELSFSVSHTTRVPRANERNGVDYHFVTPERFLQLQQADAFVECAEYNANNYGTSWDAIRGPVEEGQSVLLEIEVQGARQIRERVAEACLIFLLPPSMEVLAQRLRGRGTDDEDTINRRLAMADREISASSIFDYAVVNDMLDETVEAVLRIISAERGENPEEVRRLYAAEHVLERWRSELGTSR